MHLNNTEFGNQISLYSTVFSQVQQDDNPLPLTQSAKYFTNLKFIEIYL